MPVQVGLIQRLARRGNKLFRNVDHSSTFRDAIYATGIQLPAGQLTHVLRHTFASHFMANGGSILVLQKILGHSTLAMTMRYAHLAPDHLLDALSKLPLSKAKYLDLDLAI
ncbi:tyrosine-type recombinase/integrase [Allopseudospirillum japonicum]|uniref:tyrosine-type recombinase/integrase n=1 Tax=Allopseudospirillum japonicum TaxID=64971 RepID=UPI001FE07924